MNALKRLLFHILLRSPISHQSKQYLIACTIKKSTHKPSKHTGGNGAQK